VIVAALTPLVALHVLSAAPIAADPFAFFRPSVVVSTDERLRLDEGQAIARVLPGEDRQIAVFAAVPVNVDGDRLAAWVWKIAELKTSAAVLAIGRFSDPPRLEDLGALTLDDADLDDIRDCRTPSASSCFSAFRLTLRMAAPGRCARPSRRFYADRRSWRACPALLTTWAGTRVRRCRR